MHINIIKLAVKSAPELCNSCFTLQFGITLISCRKRHLIERIVFERKRVKRVAFNHQQLFAIRSEFKGLNPSAACDTLTVFAVISER